jgi:hypothetical protein
MKVWKDEPGWKTRRMEILLDNMGEVPDGLNEWLTYRGANKKLRGTNLAHEIYVDEDAMLRVVFGSGSLNQITVWKKDWMPKRLIKLLRVTRDKHLKPELVSVWVTTQMLEKERLRHNLLSLSASKTDRQKAYRMLRAKVRESDEEVQKFVLQVNAQITRLQKLMEPSPELKNLKGI